MGLFKPAWMTEEYTGKKAEKGERAVEKEKNQTILTEIAWKAPHSRWMSMAVEKLTDITTLTDIVKQHDDWSVRITAISKLNDLKVLINIVKNNELKTTFRCGENENCHIYLFALKRIKDLGFSKDVTREDVWEMAYRLLKATSSGDNIIRATNIIFSGDLLEYIPCCSDLKKDIRPTHARGGGNYLHKNEAVYFFKNQNENPSISQKYKKICDGLYGISAVTGNNVFDNNVNLSEKLIERLRQLKQYDN